MKKPYLPFYRSRRENCFLIQINYKSGISMSGWFYEFSYTATKSEWRSIGDKNKPILINHDAIESIWQIDYVKARKFWLFWLF